MIVVCVHTLDCCVYMFWTWCVYLLWTWCVVSVPKRHMNVSLSANAGVLDKLIDVLLQPIAHTFVLIMELTSRQITGRTGQGTVLD